MKGNNFPYKHISIGIILLIFIFMILQIGLALQAQPSGQTELRGQICAAENDASSSNSYSSSCGGTYPSSCHGDLLSCDEGSAETNSFSKNNFAGVRIQDYNASVTNCKVVQQVYLCYEWWVSGGTLKNCEIAVDANGGDSYSTVSTTCPGTTANPGITCTNVTLLESWTCENFFNTTGTRAVAKVENSRNNAGAASTQSVDALFFNVTYTNAPSIATSNPTPSNNSYINSSGFIVNVSVIDVKSDIDSCILTLDNANQTMTKVGSGRTVECNITLLGLSEGAHNFTIYANDSSGNWAVNGGYFVTIDTTFPLVSFGTGVENSYTNFSRSWIYVNLSITEANFSNMTFKLFNLTSSVNQTTYSVLTRTINFTNLLEGIYYYNVSVLDLAGNRNSTETRIITLDTTSPNVSSPVSVISGMNYSKSFIFNVSVTDALLTVNSVYFNITNSSGGQNVSYFASGPTAGYWNVSINTSHFYDGIYNITIYANDTLNNLNNSVRVYSITFDNTKPTFVLNSPANDTINLNNGTLLNATIRDANNAISVKVYGGNETSFYENNSLLYKGQGAANGTIAVYNWTSAVLNASGNSVLLMHFDLEGADNFTFVQDETGRNNGTKGGNGEIAWNSSEAKFGYSTGFDGVDDEISISDSDSLDLNGSFSISFWAYPRDLSRNQTFIVKGAGASANYYVDYKATNKIEFGFYNNGFRSVEVDASSFALNKWNLVSVTWNESSNMSKVYVNGEEKGSLQINLDISANSQPLKIGSFPGYTQNYTGLIDELVIYNIALTTAEIADIYSLRFGNWYWRIEVNDSSGNINASEIRMLRKNFIWTISPSNLGSIGAILDTNVSAGVITINNTHSSKNITINITSDYNLPITFNQSLPLTLYNTNNGSNLIRIQVNITTPTTDGPRTINFNISANDTNAGGDSVPGARIVPVSLIATSSNPFLISSFETAPLIVSQNNSGIDLKASIVNRGQGSAQSVQISFVLPAGWTSTSGALIQSLGIVEVNQQKNASIVVSINSSAAAGTAVLYANISGQNSSGADLGASFLIIGSTNITVNAISAGAGPSAQIVVVPESAGGGGGGGSSANKEKGGGSESLTFSKVLEIVRGTGESFNIEVLNRFFNSSLKNLTLEITGYPKQYIEIFPDKIELLDYNKTAAFKVKLSAPIYKDYESYVLKAIIRGTLDTPNAIKDYLEIQNIKLVIQAAPIEETEGSLAKARKAIEEMKERGFNTEQAATLLKQAEAKFKDRKNKETIDLANQIISIHDLAFRAYFLIEKIKGIIADPGKMQNLAGNTINGNTISGYAVIDTTEAQQVLDLAIVAFDRGDFYAALERAESSRLLLVLEGKSSISLFFYLYWQYVVLAIILFSGFSILSYRSHQKSTLTSNIEELNFDEDRIGKLVIELQKEYFSGKMGEKEYKGRTEQNRRKIAEIQKERLKLRNKRIRILSSEQVMQDLENESRQIENLIKKIQYDYYRDKKINEPEYKAQFNSLIERFAEIEEERATLELTKLRRQRVSLIAPSAKEVNKIVNKLTTEKAANFGNTSEVKDDESAVIVEHKLIDELKRLVEGKNAKDKWIKINLEKSEAAEKMMGERK